VNGYFHAVQLEQNKEVYYKLLIEAQNTLEFDTPQLSAMVLFRGLRYITSDALSSTNVRFPGLFSRLDYLFRTFPVPSEVRYHLHAFRHRNKAGQQVDWNEELVQEGLTALALFVHVITAIEVPTEINQCPLTIPFLRRSEKRSVLRSIRGVVTSKLNGNVVVSADLEGEEHVFILLPHEEANQAATFRIMEVNTTISLVDAEYWTKGDDDFIIGRLLVLEPDYLVDVSPLAECFRTLARTQVENHALYFVNRYKPRLSSEALFLGNLSNYFLDELIHAEHSKPEFAAYFKASFGLFPMEYLLLFPDDSSLISFMKTKAAVQFRHLVNVVQNDLQRLRPPVKAMETILEPTYISPELGIQGRLDLLHQNGAFTTIIELKSGKTPWPTEDVDAVAVNHATQARIYRMLLRQVESASHEQIRVYLLYSSSEQLGTNLRYVTHMRSLEQHIVNVRNAIALTEKAFASATDLEAIHAAMRQWSLASCNLPSDARIPDFFKDQFEHFQVELQKMSPVARDYFLAATAFISREQWEARVGDGDIRHGHAGLWNKSEEDQVSSDRLFPLAIVENAIDQGAPFIDLRLTAGKAGLFNFRKGDIVVLYPSDEVGAKATDYQVLKCFILQELDDTGMIRLGFRYGQKNKRIFEGIEHWALEHDYMDQLFQGMHREVFAFCMSDTHMKKLLLGEVYPQVPAIIPELPIAVEGPLLDSSEKELQTLLMKALAAPDFFLLVGPPGTGKTNLFLKHFVAATQAKGHEETILLIAYTNRAVDEICGAVSLALQNEEEFLRIGNSNGCDPSYHKNLLQEIAKGAKNRQHLSDLIAARKVVVATVASILNRPDIFKLKNFDRIVVDEASQVLEPMLISILNKAKRFVLIGDQKQLPAVVMQHEMPSTLISEGLRYIGITDFRHSLFERLIAANMRKEALWGTLTHQGRMHPDLSDFINHAWYNGKLKIAALPHQKEQEVFEKPHSKVFDARVAFINVDRGGGLRPKSNLPEALKAVEVVEAILAQLKGGNAAEEIGVISPYRSQNALIKSLLRKSQVGGASEIMVDTVERFQGSQRNFIVYSATVSSLAQLGFLAQSIHLCIDGVEVDRKLNVAFTRARKHFTLIGNEVLLQENPHYRRLINYALKAEV
jgi:DNA replication ATP-dependent helicase Dna2